MKQVRIHNELKGLDHIDPKNLDEGSIFVEIGSVNAHFASECWRRWGGKAIVYEAGLNFKTLQERFSNMAVAMDITLYNKAVTGKDGVTTFYHWGEHPTADSFYQKNWKSGEFQEMEVETISMETLYEQSGIHRIDILFMDCEGSEVGMLEEIISKPMLRESIDWILVEVHYELFDNTRHPGENWAALHKRMKKYYTVITTDSRVYRGMILYKRR